MAVFAEETVELGGEIGAEQAKKEGRFVLNVAKTSVVKVRGARGQVGGKASTRLKLSFVFRTVKLNDLTILADSGSARNLIAEKTLIKLPFRPPFSTQVRSSYGLRKR